MKRIISLLLSVLLVACSFCFVSNAADITVSGGTVTDLGIPLKSMFPDGNTYLTARTVWGMEEYEGKIYIGGGDYDTNAGSSVGDIPVYSYDPATGAWTKEYSVHDEQVSRFFNVWGNLYIPGMDPGSGAGEYGNVYYKTNGTWKTMSNVYRGIHMFDMLFLDDGKTVFAGLGTNTGVQPYISMSIDAGKTWNLISFKKDGAIITNTSSTWSRTHNMFEYNGEIYGTLWVSSGGNTGNMGLYKYNSTDKVMEYYAATPSSLYLNSMSSSYDFTFNGKFVNVYNGITVFNDDLTSWNTVSGFNGTPTCAKVIGDAMYFTTYQYNNGSYNSYLYKTTDLSTFELLSTVTLSDSYVLSFAYEDGVFYMGTRGYSGSTTVGTVFSLVPAKSGCTHANLQSETTEATHLENGATVEHCPDCGYTNKTVIEAEGHQYPDTWTTVTEPTCEAAGSEKRVCTVCLETETQDIPALEHEYDSEWTIDQKGDCVTDEIKSHHCINCEAKTDVTVTKAPGHNYSNRICGACGDEEHYEAADPNGDSVINVLDLTIAAQYIAQGGTTGDFDLSACDMAAADLNGDGAIGQVDLNMIARAILANG